MVKLLALISGMILLSLIPYVASYRTTEYSCIEDPLFNFCLDRAGVNRTLNASQLGGGGSTSTTFNISGTIPAIAGEMYNHTDIGYTIDIVDTSTYQNISNFTSGYLNNVSFANNLSLIINHSGAYQIDWALSFGGGGSKEYQITVKVNDNINENCESHRLLGASGDVGTTTGTCILSLEDQDWVGLGIKQTSVAPADVNIFSVNINIEKLEITGSGQSGILPLFQADNDFWFNITTEFFNSKLNFTPLTGHINATYINATDNVTAYGVQATDFFNGSGSSEWIQSWHVWDIDSEDIESDINTFVDIGGDTMAGSLTINQTAFNNIRLFLSDETESAVNASVWIDSSSNDLRFTPSGSGTIAFDASDEGYSPVSAPEIETRYKTTVNEGVWKWKGASTDDYFAFADHFHIQSTAKIWFGDPIRQHEIGWDGSQLRINSSHRINISAPVVVINHLNVTKLNVTSTIVGYNATFRDIVAHRDVNASMVYIGKDANISGSTGNFYSSGSYVSRGDSALSIADNSYAFTLESDNDAGIYFDNTNTRLEIRLGGTPEWFYTVAGSRAGAMYLQPDTSLGVSCTLGEVYVDSNDGSGNNAFCACLDGGWVKLGGAGSCA